MHIYVYIYLCMSSYVFYMYVNMDTHRHRQTERGCSRGVMCKAIDCGIVISEFELQSRYYVHFRTNTSGKDINSLIFPAMG